MKRKSKKEEKSKKKKNKIRSVRSKLQDGRYKHNHDSHIKCKLWAKQDYQIILQGKTQIYAASRKHAFIIIA